jgi:DNA-binding response OmpR family regulator
VREVLIAAGDERIADMRARQLACAGVRVRRARTGFEAIVKAACHMPELIVLDSSLGQDVVDHTIVLLAACPTTADIPTIRTAGTRRVPRRAIQHVTAAAVL